MARTILSLAIWHVANHLIFVTGGKAFFKLDKDKLPRRRFILFAAAYLTLSGATSATLFRQQRRSSIAKLAGALLMLTSTALFGKAVRATRAAPLTPIHSADVPNHILRDGIYRYIRHPFYTSYLANFAAAAVMSHSPLSWVCFLAASWIYVRAARAEEAKFAASPLAREYAEYKAETAMLVPRIL